MTTVSQIYTWFSKPKRCFSRYLDLFHNFSVIPNFLLNPLLPMYPFSPPRKHQKALRLREQRKDALRTNGLMTGMIQQLKSFFHTLLRRLPQVFSHQGCTQLTFMKYVQFSRPPTPLSIYFQNSSTPLTLDVQFQCPPSQNDIQSIKKTT